MGTFYAHPHFLPVYVELARVYRLPLRMAPRRLNAARQAAEQNQQVTLDGLLMLDDIRNIALRNPLELKAHLLETLRTLQTGRDGARLACRASDAGSEGDYARLGSAGGGPPPHDRRRRRAPDD